MGSSVRRQVVAAASACAGGEVMQASWMSSKGLSQARKSKGGALET